MKTQNRFLSCLSNLLLISALIFMSTLLCMSLTSCSSPEQNSSESDLEYIKDKGTLVIGYTVYEPMNYTDENGNFTGFDTELATKVCEKLGVKPVFQEIDWGTKEVELKGKTVDCLWNGMTIDKERAENMNCTNPYVKNAQVVVVKEGAEYNGPSSLIGKSVAAEIGSAGESQIKNPESDLSKCEYVGKAVQTDCLMEVNAGTAYAAVLDMTLAKAMIGEDTDYSSLKIVDKLAVETYGAAFRKGSDVRDEVNKIFDDLSEEGFLPELAEKYGLELAD